MTSIEEQLGCTELDPVESAAWEFAHEYERRGRRKLIPSAFEVIVITLMNRIRELEAENVLLRRLG